jgi:uncharacterized ubiquitin-like protein YukD
MEQRGFILKLGHMWVCDYYAYTENINLTTEKMKAKVFNREEAENIRNMSGARIISVKLILQEFGIE